MSNSDFDFSSFSLTDSLPPLLQDNKFYTDYLDASSDIWKENVFPYIKLLSELRQIINLDTKQEQELWVLIRNANLLGYKFLSNYMTQANYVKLVEFISRFYETQGTKQLANFIGFIRGAGIAIEQLWSPLGDGDYTIFVEKRYTNGNTVVTHPGQTTPGTFYPTSHYRINYGLDKTGVLDNNILTDLFYNLAPIHFILESVIASIDFVNEPFYLDVQSYSCIEEPVLVDIDLVAITYDGGTPITLNGEPLAFLQSV